VRGLDDLPADVRAAIERAAQADADATRRRLEALYLLGACGAASERRDDELVPTTALAPLLHIERRAATRIARGLPQIRAGRRVLVSLVAAREALAVVAGPGPQSAPDPAAAARRSYART
jgi:hypothetical protein